MIPSYTFSCSLSSQIFVNHIQLLIHRGWLPQTTCLVSENSAKLINAFLFGLNSSIQFVEQIILIRKSKIILFKHFLELSQRGKIFLIVSEPDSCFTFKNSRNRFESQIDGNFGESIVQQSSNFHQKVFCIIFLFSLK